MYSISGKEFGNFVFLCSSENENKSNLISALDTYRKRKIQRYSQNEEMLKKKLCMTGNSFYAADVDDDW